MITVIAYFQELFSFSFVIVNNTCTGSRILSRSSNMLAQSLLRNVTAECRSEEVDRGSRRTLSLAVMFDF